MKAIRRILANTVRLHPARRARLSLDLADVPVYAVGDIHGCHDQFSRLEQRIVADARRFQGRKLLIMLGDYVDRGPASASVISHLVAPPPDGFDRICLVGNHEMAMLDFLDGRLTFPDWARMGGAQTLMSYGVDPTHLESIGLPEEQIATIIRDAIPEEHVEFLRSLPILVDSRRCLFVHAGIRPGVEIEDQSDEDLVFIRSGFLDSDEPLKKWIIHGHTPIERVGPRGRRLNLDTGAYLSGRLTAARLWQGRASILSVSA